MKWKTMPFRRAHHYPEETHLRPEKMGSLVITESIIGLLIGLGLITSLALSLVEARIFFLGVLIFGGLLGLFLWWRHR